MLNKLFSIFGRSPGGDAGDDPVLVAAVDVAAAPDAIYRLLDPSGGAHRWGLRGDKIEAVDAARGLYRLIDQRMPDAPFLVQIDDLAPGARVETTTFGEGGKPIGALAKTASRYEIAPAPNGSRVTLRETPTFVDGMSAGMMKKHRKLMMRGLAIDLEKLKAEAEKSV